MTIQVVCELKDDIRRFTSMKQKTTYIGGLQQKITTIITIEKFAHGLQRHILNDKKSLNSSTQTKKNNTPTKSQCKHNKLIDYVRYF